jgi:hypothetical protein
MASYFTSAQLALFRSALSTLAGGIAEGDKDNADVKVLSEVQQTQIVERELVEDNLIQPVITPAKESSKPESKKLFPGFSWFSKKDKSVVAPRADKSILDEAQVAAKTTFVESEVVAVANPKTVSRVASDSHLVISFFTGLPWSKKNAAAGSAPAFSATKHGFESKIDGDYQPDSRIAGSFFTDLPWSSKAKIAVAPVAISADRDYSEEIKVASLVVQSVSSYFPGLPWSEKSVKTGVATQPVALDVKTDNLPVLSRNTVSVNSFFASLPWSNDSRKSADSVVAPGLAAKQESVTQSPKTITIDRKSAAQRISSPSSEADRLVKDYFAALPWTLKAAKSVQKLDSTLSIQSNVTNLVSNARAADAISGQTVSSFFSNAAWAQPKAGSANTQGAKFDLKQSISESQSERFATAVDSYFQALPWQVKPASKGTEAFSITGTGNSGSTGMFAAATQSALRASQKGKMNNSQPENKRIDTFFSSLPWSGNG